MLVKGIGLFMACNERGVRALRSKCSFININKRRSDRQSSVTVTGVT